MLMLHSLLIKLTRQKRTLGSTTVRQKEVEYRYALTAWQERKLLILRGHKLPVLTRKTLQQVILTAHNTMCFLMHLR